MRNFVLIMLIVIAIPFIYLMGYKGLTFDEMLEELNLRKG